ncbi:hypothetical protein BJX62DRAFT_201845 [Aspergillus germanicus]
MLKPNLQLALWSLGKSVSMVIFSFQYSDCQPAPQMFAIPSAPSFAFHGCFTMGESACASATVIAFLIRVAISSS